jgi:C-terminal processing protease CtpA/Prc
MRKFLLQLLVLFLIVAISSNCSAEQAGLTPMQIARLESLCQLWGVVKFFHPWIVSPPDGKPADWDAALIETIPLVEAASDAEDFRRAIDHLLAALHDPATRAVLPGSAQENSGQEPVQSGLPETNMVESGGKKILVITATDWRRLAADPKKSSGGLFEIAFNEADSADSILLDLRRQDAAPDFFDGNAQVVCSSLLADVASLLKSDLTLAALRSRFHAGYAPEQGSTSGGYKSGFSVAEHPVLRAKPGPSAGKQLVILTNAGTALGATALLAALQAAGQAIVLHDSLGVPNMTPDGIYTLYLTDGVVASVRIADSVNADGSVGFDPDLSIGASNEAGGDALFDKALAIARGELNPPARSSARPSPGPRRISENAYPEMASPSREYRLLGLFRVWNVMHYFFPYKHLMDRSWESVLTEFIPRFAQVEAPGEYGLAARELVANLQDSHVGAYGGAVGNAADESLGRARPLVLTRPIGREMVVVVVDASVSDRVHVGDVVLAVDGEAVAERSARHTQRVAASTPQALAKAVCHAVLRGPADSAAKLTLRAPDGAVREETIPRTTDGAAFGRLFEGLQRTTPVYSVLPQGYGYFDLVRLTISDVSAAFDTVKDCSALIMDMRGYPKGTAWEICARFTNKPMSMAMFRRPYWTSPYPFQTDLTFLQPIQPSPLWKYTGRVVVLINDDAISQSEHSCLGFEEAAKGRITFVGTPTQGANGDITNTSMPGGIRVVFSGHDVRHADGRQLQRVGIQPDIKVESTVEGLVTGKDEVLDAAINFLNEVKPE